MVSFPLFLSALQRVQTRGNKSAAYPECSAVLGLPETGEIKVQRSQWLEADWLLDDKLGQGPSRRVLLFPSAGMHPSPSIFQKGTVLAKPERFQRFSHGRHVGMPPVISTSRSIVHPTSASRIQPSACHQSSPDTDAAPDQLDRMLARKPVKMVAVALAARRANARPGTTAPLEAGKPILPWHVPVASIDGASGNTGGFHVTRSNYRGTVSFKIPPPKRRPVQRGELK
jgi:hypothetical protein